VQDVDEHDAAAAQAARLADQQMARRRERQARVGLLRNTNRPPLPPMRRPPLIGRHLSLRSSRRPKPAPDPVVAESPPDPTPALTLDSPAVIESEAGRIASIDIERLERLAEALSPPTRSRMGFSDRFLGAPDTRSEAAPAPPEPPSAESVPDPLAEPAPPTPPGWRAALARLLGRG
jgi:hypothetical protein